MEFTATKKDFNSALTKAQGIPEQKNLSSVMANVMLESVGKDSVRLTAQSYEVTLVTTFPAEVAAEGQMALSGRSLFDATRMLPDAPVKLTSMDNDWADLKAGRTDYKIPGILPSNLPDRQEPKTTDQVAVPSDLLIEMAERVGFAMSADEGRPNLNGIYMKVEPGEGGVHIEMVSTDGHRLARLSRTIDKAGIDQVLGVIIHRKGVNELKRFLADVEGDVTVGFQRNAVVFQVESGYLLVRQVELEYPDYLRVLPDEFKWEFKVDRAEMTRAVQRAGVVISAEKTPLIKLTLGAGQIQLLAQDPDKGDAHSEVDLDYSGEPLEISFNNRYLVEAMNALPGKEVVFGIKDLSSATSLTTPDDDGILQLIMPVRI
ncbi:MAG: DNA polymerase III subunit beta [Deltaproteobacteria bacterium]|nr:DNA polymerase III subunit beta [Deltaproteobacteria bacterium]